MDDKRKSPRRRVLKGGKIVFADALRVIDCRIRDLSPDGARLIIASTMGIPDTFLLLEQSTGKLYPTSVVWRQAAALGVKFNGPPTSIHDDVNRRYARLRFM